MEKFEIIKWAVACYLSVIGILLVFYKQARSKIEVNCTYFWGGAKAAHISEQVKRLEQFYSESQDPKSLHYKENRLTHIGTALKKYYTISWTLKILTFGIFHFFE